MASFDRNIFYRLLRTAPQRHFRPEAAVHSDYLQREFFDRLDQDGEVDLSKLDWDAFSMRNVTPEWYPDQFDMAEERMIKGMCNLFQKTAPASRTERTFF